MATNKAIAAIEAGKLVEAHGFLEKSLYIRADSILEEKKKQIVAKTFGKQKQLTEDSKSILNASKRKAFREKLQKLKSVK